MYCKAKLSIWCGVIFLVKLDGNGEEPSILITRKIFLSL